MIRRARNRCQADDGPPSFRETFDLLCPRRLADRIVEEIIEQDRAEEEDE